MMRADLTLRGSPRLVALIATVFLSLASAAAVAQVETPRAGGADTINTEAEFQKLIEKCDNTELLFERGKLRLVLGRTTNEAAGEAQKLLNEAFAQCGDGKIDEAKATIQQGFEIAQAGVQAKLEQDQAAAAAKSAAAQETAAASEAETGTGEKKPWWQFW